MSLRRSGSVLAAAAMTCVGSSVAVSSTITGAPLFTLQAVRYAFAAVLLVVLARATGRRLPRPHGWEWAWLGGIALTGLVIFNIGVVRGTAHAEPAVIGVAVAAVPLVLALAGPLVGGTRPSAAVVAGAAVVSVGRRAGLRRRPHRPRRAGLGGGGARGGGGVHAARGAGAGPPRAVGGRAAHGVDRRGDARGARGRRRGARGGRHPGRRRPPRGGTPRRRRHRAGVRALVHRRHPAGSGPCGALHRRRPG